MACNRYEKDQSAWERERDREYEMQKLRMLVCHKDAGWRNASEAANLLADQRDALQAKLDRVVTFLEYLKQHSTTYGYMAERHLDYLKEDN